MNDASGPVQQTEVGPSRSPHGFANKAGRALWGAVWLVLFRPTPYRLGAGWRRFLLRLFGATLGRTSVHPTARIWAPWMLTAGDDVFIDRDVNLYNAFGITIGDRVVVSFGTTICTATHDFRDPKFPLIGQQVRIESDTWIAAEAFVVPGVTVGAGAVVGARAVVTKTVAPWTIAAGNPAKPVGIRKLGAGSSQPPVLTSP